MSHTRNDAATELGESVADAWMKPIPPRLVIDPDNPRKAYIDGRAVTRGVGKCSSCDRPLNRVSESRTYSSYDPDLGDPKPAVWRPGNFPGPASRCARCVHEELRAQDSWMGGPRTHELVREALELTAGATRPAELKLAAGLAAELEALGPDDDYLFPLGIVRVGGVSARIGVYGDAILRPLLARHVRGDFGVEGAIPGTITPECKFWPEVAGQAERNALAIREGLGLIRSGYRIDHVNPTQEGRLFSSTVRIGTFIDGRKCETLIVVQDRSHANV